MEITLDRKEGGDVGDGEPDNVGEGERDNGDVGGKEGGSVRNSAAGAAEEGSRSLLLTFSFSEKGTMLW